MTWRAILIVAETVKGLNGKAMTAVFTGNGRRERYVLESMAKKFNGTDKVLLLSKVPFHFRPSPGLSALKATKIYVSKYGIRRILFLVDKEHFHQKDVGKELDGALKGFGIGVQNIESPEGLEQKALIVNGLVGFRQVTIYVVVLGEEKRLEENIANLVELELGIKVEPNKEEIHTVLHKCKSNIHILVEKAQKKILTEAFPALTFILKEIEKNDVEE